MAMKIRERVPVHLLRSSQETDSEDPLELTGYRFMGVLMHPVPRSEMLRRCDVDHRGCKLVVQWPAGTIDHPVKAGDVLQIGGATHEVCGVEEHAGCYLDIYVEDR